jgi:hypothetical protein
MIQFRSSLDEPESPQDDEPSAKQMLVSHAERFLKKNPALTGAYSAIEQELLMEANYRSLPAEVAREVALEIVTPTQATPKIRIGKPPEQRRTPQSFAVVSNSVQSIEGAPSVTWNLCSVNAMRIVINLLFLVNAKKDKAFWTFRTTCYELSRSLGLHYDLSREQAEKLLKEVAGIVFTIQKTGVFAAMPVTAIAKLEKASGAITLKLNPELQPYLLDLDDYRKLYPSMLKLRSSRTMLLYLLLRRFVGLRNPHHSVPLKDLQRIMQSAVPWKELRRSYLDPAIKDINQRTELAVSYKLKRPEGVYRKRGEVEALVFEVRERHSTKLLKFKADKP